MELKILTSSVFKEKERISISFWGDKSWIGQNTLPQTQSLKATKEEEERAYCDRWNQLGWRRDKSFVWAAVDWYEGMLNHGL